MIIASIRMNIIIVVDIFTVIVIVILSGLITTTVFDFNLLSLVLPLLLSCSVALSSCGLAMLSWSLHISIHAREESLANSLTTSPNCTMYFFRRGPVEECEGERALGLV